MADTAVAITAGSGTNIDTRTEGTNGNHRQVIVVGDPSTNAAVASVVQDAPTTNDYGMVVAIHPDSVNANGQTTMSASAPVVIASNQTGFPVFPSPTTTGGLSIFRSLDMDETEEDVKTSAGCLYKLRITNRTTTIRYVKLYNATAANVTVGTTTPIDTIPVPAGGSADLATVITENFGGLGLTFDTALSIAATTGFADNDTGAPGTNDVIVTAYYK